MNRPLRKRTMSKVEIAQMYKAGESTTIIAEMANVSPGYIRIVLKELEVPLRPRGSWKRKFKVNEDYFKTWSNNMAYILGFIAADGMISGHAQLISIAQKEKEILLDIKREMDSSHPITKNERTGVHMLNIGSKILKEDLIHIHGIRPNKTKHLSMPNIPDLHLSHYVRGYFDGDGSINYQKKQIVFVGGSHQFFEELNKLIKRRGIRSYLKVYQTYTRLIISGRQSIKGFGDRIYADSDLRLDRKYEEYLKENQNYDDLEDGKHVVSKAAIKERKNKFLMKFIKSGCITKCCAEINIEPTTFKNWMKNDLEFQQRWNELNKIKERGG
ncbi:endonuclease [Halobacillus trueperi]|uniref:Endonuclease n=1 Tax=Halobacillus trueperi TaxID=156205 RepID=A0A3D8VHB3_9BACI|nr:LAGLIDADG family homing endonuclease [Halobacillus trueperi]RDY68471.1 endonuclease [Halobacillus trueperi]